VFVSLIPGTANPGSAVSRPAGQSTSESVSLFQSINKPFLSHLQVADVADFSFPLLRIFNKLTQLHPAPSTRLNPVPPGRQRVLQVGEADPNVCGDREHLVRRRRQPAIRSQ
jgi:hypothetical protein